MKRFFFFYFTFFFFKVGLLYADFSGSINSFWTQSKVKNPDGSTQETTFNNYFTFLNYSHRFTDLLSFYSSLRTTYRTSNFSNDLSRKDKYYEVVPDIALTLNNPIYQFRIGDIYQYRKYESSEVGRDTENKDNLIFVHFNLMPYNLPRIFSQLNLRNYTSTVGGVTKDTKDLNYLINSNYDFSYKDLRGSYYLSYNFDELSTPKEDIYKSRTKTLSGNVDLNYSKVFFQEKVAPYLNYRMTFTQSESTWYSNLNEAFVPVGGGTGLYANGTPPSPDPYPYNMTVMASLTDNNLLNATSINLKDQYQNIGIKFAIPQKIEKLRLYIKTTNFNNLNWKVFLANDPILGASSWTELTTFSISWGIYDSINDIYYIDFLFLSPQQYQYFKVVNLDPSLNDMWVTEIVAYEKVTFGQGKAQKKNNSITEEFNFTLRHRLTEKLSLEEGFYLRRTEFGDFNQWSSIGKVFSSFSNPGNKTVEEPFVEVNRNYFGNLRYNFRPNLQTTLSFNRAETSNNQPNRYYSNNYRWSWGYTPFERLNLVLSLSRIENFLYSREKDTVEKSSTSDSLIFNISAKVYKEVQWTSDHGIIRTENYYDNSTTRGFFSNHLVNIPLTRRLTLYINGNYEKSKRESDLNPTETTAYRISPFISYRPGASVNLNYGFSYAKSDEQKYLSNNFYLNWRITRLLLLNTGLNFYEYRPSGSKGWSFNGNLVWYPRKFLDLRLAYDISSTEYKERGTGKSTVENINLWINFRF